MLDLNAVEDDEEYKKKLERARLLRNSFGMITSKDEEINNTTTNNNTYSTKEISDYQDKLEKARKLRNSFGMTTLKDIELENEVSNYISDNQNTYPQTVQNNNISQVQNTQQTNDSSNMPVTTNVDFYKLAQSGNMYKEQITENSSNIQKINILDTPIVSKKDPRVQSNLGYLKYGQKTRQD